MTTKNDPGSTAAPCASSSSSTRASSSGDTEDATILDLRGEVCPYTFVYTRLQLEKMDLGARLMVLVDHEPATRNVPRSARAWGQDVIRVEPVDPAEKGQGAWRIILEKRVP